MEYQGSVSKMITELAAPVIYHLPIGDFIVPLNQQLGTQISLSWLSEIRCLHCGKITKKSFGQGFCYPCFVSIPETEDCVLRPELCRAHEGIARDMEWAREHCLQDHYVYLALSSSVKVGVTRQSQIPTRWIDQGATQAIRLAKTPNRYIAGLLETELKKHLTDKTNWRHMLSNKIADQVYLLEEKKKAGDLLPNHLQPYLSSNDEITEITYPNLSYPTKITSIDLEKTPIVQGKLTAIKGQYLMLDNEKVINIRKYGGYTLKLKL